MIGFLKTAKRRLAALAQNVSVRFDAMRAFRYDKKQFMSNCFFYCYTGTQTRLIY